MERAGAFVWAHRGSRLRAPENSLEAFARARAEGAGGIELDVRLSRDFEAVVIHDSSLKRTAGADALVRDLTLRELKRIDPGIPSLEEVLRMFAPGMRVNAELKTDPGSSEAEIKRLSGAVADLFKRYGGPDSCMASAFDPRALDAFTRAAPGFESGWLLKPGFLAGRFPGRPRRFDALHPHFTMATPRFILRARRELKAVNVWTVNNPLFFRLLSCLGVGGIITDDPLALRFRPVEETAQAGFDTTSAA